MVPAVVHGQFAVVLHRLFIADGAGGVGLLPQAVTDVLLAGQDVLDHLPRPALDACRRGDVFLDQFPLNIAQAAALQVAGVDQPHRLGLFRVDLRPAVRPPAVAQRPAVLEGDIALFHALTYPRDDIQTHGLALRLGKAAEQGDQELAGLSQRIDVFLFKDHGDAPGLEGADHLEAVHRVPGEPGGGLGEDHVDAAPLAGGDHTVELRPLFHAGAGDTLIREDSSHLPIGIFLDFLRVIVLLGGVAALLLLAVGGHPAVGGDTLSAAVPGAAGGGGLGGGDDAHPAFQYCLFHGDLLAYLKWTVMVPSAMVI